MRYRVYGAVTVGCVTEVEADSEAEAYTAAEGRTAMLAMGGVEETEHWVVEEADGVPVPIRAEPLEDPEG